MFLLSEVLGISKPTKLISGARLPIDLFEEIRESVGVIDIVGAVAGG